ncbi:MAG: hypothetical protein AVDCRST_MAG05-3222, partial [uncultured Rubrobacteraceae bacterium]
APGSGRTFRRVADHSHGRPHGHVRGRAAEVHDRGDKDHRPERLPHVLRGRIGGGVLDLLLSVHRLRHLPALV